MKMNINEFEKNWFFNQSFSLQSNVSVDDIRRLSLKVWDFMSLVKMDACTSPGDPSKYPQTANI